MKYQIKNWEDFQHYKNRNPPWIKLHFELWTSKDWVMLADASRLVLIVCMMLGSRNKGVIDDDVDYIKRVAHLDNAPDLKPLIDSGFLIPLETLLAGASNRKQPLADARIEERQRREEKRQSRVDTFIPPTILQVQEYCKEKKYTFNPEVFVANYESKGWMIGRNKMKSWQAACVKWHNSDFNRERSSDNSEPWQGGKCV